ncbi:MAG: NUDIX hydrolase [Candidatus Kapaibacterium sp.]
MLKKLRRISSRTLHENPWWSYRQDRYLRPDDTEGDYFYIKTPGSVAIMAELPNGKFLLLKQFRYLNQTESLEFIGGGMKPGHSPEDSAREEMLEEAGLTADELIPIGKFNPMNGATDELCFVFLARGLHQDTPKPEQTEEFERVELSMEELERLIGNGTLWDGMTLATLSLYRSYLLASKKL